MIYDEFKEKVANELECMIEILYLVNLIRFFSIASLNIFK